MKINDKGNGSMSCTFSAEELKKMGIDIQKAISDDSYRISVTLELSKKCVLLASTKRPGVRKYTTMSYSDGHGIRIDLYPCSGRPDDCPYHESGECAQCGYMQDAEDDDEDDEEYEYDDYDDEDDEEYEEECECWDDGSVSADRPFSVTIRSDNERLKRSGVDLDRLRSDGKYRDAMAHRFIESTLGTALNVIVPVPREDGASFGHAVEKLRNGDYKLTFREPRTDWMTPEYSIGITGEDIEQHKIDLGQLVENASYAEAAFLYIASCVADSILTTFQEIDKEKRAGKEGYAGKYVRFTGAGMEATFLIHMDETLPAEEAVMAVRTEPGSMDKACRACAAILATGVMSHGPYRSSLYEKDGLYSVYAECLLHEKDKIMSALSENDILAGYGRAETIKAVFDEHWAPVVKENAVAKLSALA